jgi:hypothetical protein
LSFTASNAKESLQFIEAAAILALTLVPSDKFFISGKLRPAYDAKQSVSGILRAALGTFKMRTQSFPAFPAVL